MSETISLIDNSSVGTVKPGDREAPDDGSLEHLSPIVNSPFRKIEFRLATAVTHDGGGGGAGTFQLERLNPTTSSSNNSCNGVTFEQLSGGSLGKKRDASELDVENSFGITFRRIGAGLENLGNTCFLNSVLQCLTYTEPLAAYLQSGKHQITCRNAGFCALCAIQKHVSRALRSSGKSLAPKDLVSNLRYISQTFRSSRQEDAHEYMVNLLESMHRCCLPLGLPSESPCAYERSLVHNIFGGRLRSQVKCMQCNYCSNKFEPFLDLSLEILEADTLYKAFADFTCKEQLDGGEKQYQCEQCKQKVKALKQLTIHEAPNVLTMHLKRFGCHMSGQKIDKKVHFSLTLDLKPFVTGPYDGDLRYTLYGVLVHVGWSTHSGHYYCFVRTSSGMWYSLDDSQVIQVSEKTVFEQKAYMLFYVRDRKNFPSKMPAADVHQQETGMITMEQSNACSIIREGKTKGTLESPAQKGMPESCSESDMVNLASMHGTTKSDMLIATNDAMKVPSNSLCDVAKKLSPMNDKSEACLTMLQEHKDKRSTHKDFSNSMAVTICSKPEMAPGGSAYVADEDVAISEPYSADGDGGGDDSQKRVVTSMGKENFSIDKKVVERKRQKKVKKMKVTSMKFCSNILVGASRNKKRHKPNKRIKNVDVSRMKSDKTSDVCIENKFNERAYEGGSLRGLESCRSLQHKTELIRILTADRTVPRWDEDDVASIGYVGDEGEEEYEQEKRKKKARKEGRKERKRKRKQAERWRSDNRPFRI